jgi:Xaa-Pro aminopeptidase
VVITSRVLFDIPAQLVVESQEWIKDVRGALDVSPLIERIKELGLEKGTIGMGGVGSGAMNYGSYSKVQSAFPSDKLVDVSDIFSDLRTIKSEEEIMMIDMANRIFDAAVKRVHEVARPGMLGREVVQEGIKAMWEAGGDVDSIFGFHFGAVPKQNPVHMKLCMDKKIKAGDIGTLTAHSEYGHYAGHSDHQVSFGAPKPLHRDMFQAVLDVRDTVLKIVKEGLTQVELIETYQKACQQAGFRASPHPQAHQYGIDVPEYPGPSFRVPDDSKEQLSKKAGLGFGGGNFVLKAGMIYSISPTLMAKDGEDTMLAGTTLAVTPTGYRELGDRRVELLTCG